MRGSMRDGESGALPSGEAVSPFGNQRSGHSQPTLFMAAPEAAACGHHGLPVVYST